MNQASTRSTDTITTPCPRWAGFDQTRNPKVARANMSLREIEHRNYRPGYKASSQTLHRDVRDLLRLLRRYQKFVSQAHRRASGPR